MHVKATPGRQIRFLEQQSVSRPRALCDDDDDGDVDEVLDSVSVRDARISEIARSLTVFRSYLLPFFFPPSLSRLRLNDLAIERSYTRANGAR